MALMNLPTELFVLILEEVGGRELRRVEKLGCSRLTVCRKWYHAALSIYLSGLSLAEIKIRGNTLKDLSKSLGYQGARKLMHKNTRTLRVRLHGHWWDQKISREADEFLEAEDRELEDIDAQNEPPLEFDPESHTTDKGSILIKKWQDRDLNPELVGLLDDLSKFTTLESLRFEAMREPELEIGPQWDYLHSTTFLSLTQHLPLAHDLASITLDTSGTSFLSEDADFHPCAHLAKILPHIEHVRIRMTTICPQLLVFDSDLTPAQLRNKRMVIKLHQPFYANASNMLTDECFHKDNLSRSMKLHNKMITAAQRYAQSVTTSGRQGRSELPQGLPPQALLDNGMDLLRISYIDRRTPVEQTVDCLTMRKLYYCGQDHFMYEDDGTPRWFEEDSKSMRQAEAFQAL